MFGHTESEQECEVENREEVATAADPVIIGLVELDSCDIQPYEGMTRQASGIGKASNVVHQKFWRSGRFSTPTRWRAEL